MKIKLSELKEIIREAILSELDEEPVEEPEGLEEPPEAPAVEMPGGEPTEEPAVEQEPDLEGEGDPRQDVEDAGDEEDLERSNLRVFLTDLSNELPSRQVSAFYEVVKVLENVSKLPGGLPGAKSVLNKMVKELEKRLEDKK